MDFSIKELMAVTLARDLRNSDVALAGGALSEVPFAACLLAQKTHAPDLTIITGSGSVNPQPSSLHESGGDYGYFRNCEARITIYDIFELSENGGISCIFYGGMQLDQFGNFNLTMIGEDWSKPKIRGPGLVNISFAVTGERYYLYVEQHNTRLFVPKVDFISAPGNLDESRSRKDEGIHTEGPRLCVTPLGVFGFSEEHGGKMILQSIHPGHSIREIEDNTGFPVLLDNNLKVTDPPTEEELWVLRREIDTTGFLKN